MAEHKIKFNIPSGWGTVTVGQVGISSLFSNWVKFCLHQSKLRYHGLIALEQLLSPDCKVLLSWMELRCQVHTLSYRVPQWFIEIESILQVSLPGNCGQSISLPPSISP